jgi:hypothetical protein
MDEIIAWVKDLSEAEAGYLEDLLEDVRDAREHDVTCEC